MIHVPGAWPRWARRAAAPPPARCTGPPPSRRRPVCPRGAGWERPGCAGAAGPRGCARRGRRR
ncbi:hypothetical protein D7V93_28605 [Corallococcus llansteffanensis]|uniref:Uncharacterized protein n=1 Tax=Corallococcus llansteffanensis TaxID=2316731 RepID=A0A3A8PBH8_9BACT|nr:hypothetical protein D7V93_28605 [Corallococcus llansteffanensis]